MNEQGTILRQSEKSDIDDIMKIIDEAKAFLKAQGVDQWQKGYPDRTAIEGDIADGTSYILKKGGQVVGTVMVTSDAEEIYENIEGAWKSEQPYVAVHRMAVSASRRGEGLAEAMFGHIEKLCAGKGIHSIKLDTDGKNFAMQSLLEKLGFSYCGIVYFDNSEKIAFEKVLL